MKELKTSILLSAVMVLIIFLNACKITPDQIENPDNNQNPNNNHLPLITTYYWEDGWVKHASWRIADFGNDLTIDIDAWNWEPQFSPLCVKFDNVIARGDISLITDSEGLVDNFDDGIIKEIWDVSASEGASVYELNGVLNIDIIAGATQEGFNNVGGVITNSFVIHGDFDVQVDFIVCPEYHNTPNCNAKLFLTDQNGKSVEISIRTGRYESKELPGEGEPGFIINWTQTGHQVGKLRITRTSPTGEL